MHQLFFEVTYLIPTPLYQHYRMYINCICHTNNVQMMHNREMTAAQQTCDRYNALVFVHSTEHNDVLNNVANTVANNVANNVRNTVPNTVPNNVQNHVHNNVPNNGPNNLHNNVHKNVYR